MKITEITVGAWTAKLTETEGCVIVVYRKKGSDRSLTSDPYDSKQAATRAARVILDKLAA